MLVDEELIVSALDGVVRVGFMHADLDLFHSDEWLVQSKSGRSSAGRRGRRWLG